MLKKHLNKFIIVYLNNIIIYSKTEEKHYKYIIKLKLKKVINKNKFLN